MVTADLSSHTFHVSQDQQSDIKFHAIQSLNSERFLNIYRLFNNKYDRLIKLRFI